MPTCKLHHGLWECLDRFLPGSSPARRQSQLRASQIGRLRMLPGPGNFSRKLTKLSHVHNARDGGAFPKEDTIGPLLPEPLADENGKGGDGDASVLLVAKGTNGVVREAIANRVFWPVLFIATLATAVGSQAIISATFSIISQCRALGCFPRIKVVHTSSHVHGQIYIPEVNWTLMSLCLAVTIGFRDTEMIGNAYGLAVILVMFATTCLMFLVITTVWNRSVLWAALFAAGFGSMELLYLSACLAKVPHGGWLPLLLSLATLLVMSAWHYGTAKKQEYELQNKVCLDHFIGLSSGMGLLRVPGVGFVYSDSVAGVPPMFAHFVTNFPAFHRVLVFVSLQTLTVPKVPPEERFLVGRIGRPEHRMFRCVVRYGYKEGRWDHFNFEDQLLVKVLEFLQLQQAERDAERL
uniref:Putative potassium transporter 13 n=1 Tax=Aegilops tauschii TaxID=37682 RepID=M8B1T0_AEGTA